MNYRTSMLSRLKKILPANKIARFLLTILILYLPWQLIDVYVASADPTLIIVKIWLAGYHVLLKTNMLLSVPLLKIFTDVPVTTTYNTVTLGNHGTLLIGNPCLCADVICFFTFFIMAYPGRWKKKLWYIPMGIITIQLINVLRIVALCLIQIHHPEWMSINHKYIFNIIIFAYVFILWIIWITRFSEADLLKKTPAKNVE